MGLLEMESSYTRIKRLSFLQDRPWVLVIQLLVTESCRVRGWLLVGHRNILRLIDVDRALGYPYHPRPF